MPRLVNLSAPSLQRRRREPTEPLEIHLMTRWQVFQRVREVDSALQLNIVRLVAIIGFYSIHLFTYFSNNNLLESDIQFHWGATWIGLGWLLMTLATFIAYFAQHLPRYAKYFSTIVDVLLLTALAAIGAKTNASIIVVYFVIVTSAMLRFSKWLVAVATLGCCLGFMALVGITDEKWFDAQHDVPLARQLFMILALLLTGVIGWQVCRSSQKWFEQELDS
jgi:hypothetical protein